MIGKIGISVVSLVILVGAVMGVVILLKHNEHTQEHAIGSNSPTKIIASICEMADYKEACTSSLESTAKNSSATAKDYIHAVVGAPLDEVKKAIEAAGKVNVNKETDPYNHAALQDCKDLLELAVDYLKASNSLVDDSDVHNIENTNQHELLSWMSGIYALQKICQDQIDKPEYKSVVEKGMVNATQLTHNAVKILAELSQLLKLFNVQPHHRRRLLSSSVDDGSSYPTWFNSGDRKLLARREIRANVVVAKDGSGQFQNVQDAVNAYPANHKGRFIIYVKAGVYNEQVTINKTTPNIFIYGDGIDRTIITDNKNYGNQKINTTNTATFSNEAIGFVAWGITFQNTAGPEGHQAVAFRSKGDKSALFECSFEGNQDTLYYQAFKQYYHKCRIYGTIDFIFGKGEALIQDSDIIVRRPLPNQFNTVTADGKDIREGSNGLVIQKCRIIPDNFLFPVRFQVKTYLGRPWSARAQTVVMQSELRDLINPEGWTRWNETSLNHETCLMFEYKNRGPGAVTDRRNKLLFKHFKVLNYEHEAAPFTALHFLDGKTWLPQTGIPYNLGF